MGRQNHQTVLWSALIILIGVLLLAWSPWPTQTGLALPPRETPTPTRWLADRDDNNADDKPAGASIILQVQPAPAGLWTIIQWQDNAGGWHDVEGWQGTLDADGTKLWWVAAKDLGTGPFRWVIAQGDEALAKSDPFYLPQAAGEVVIVEVLLAP